MENIEFLEFEDIKNNLPESKKIEEFEPEEVISNSGFLTWFESFINNK